MRVQWATLDARTYEDMVAVAVKRLHPNAVHIDGSGGDGGRDMVVRDGDQQMIFEFKSFTGRLNRSRRVQVERSLARAATHSPSSWFLVVPINPNPTEERWFEGLQGTYAFPLTWHGLTWLNSQMAAMPDIARYFCADANAEVVNLLRELREEQSVTDAPTATQRVEQLYRRLNEIDPHYTYSFVVGESANTPRPPGSIFSVRFGSSRVDVYERYRGAAEDRPITVSATLRLHRASDELRTQLDEAFDFGDPVTVPADIFQNITIDAPAGLGTSVDSGVLTIAGNETRRDAPLAVTLAVMESTATVCSLGFHFTHMRGGRRGVVLRGRDETGCISSELRADGRKLNVSWRFDLRPASALPSVVRVAGLWLQAIRPPRILELRLDGVNRALARQTISRPIVDSTAFDELLTVVEALDDVQRMTGMYFPVPHDLTREDADAIVTGRRLLRGERVSVPWTSMRMTITPATDASLVELASDGRVPMRVTGEEWLELGGRQVLLGKAVTQFVARVTNVEAIREWRPGNGSGVELLLEPAGEPTATRWLQNRGSPAD